ncbi:MAG: hypothetical protein H5T86_03845 [Armatimonadetes bacterium]|nr:hypothetical protein [Armatimonadota bacterium]
MSMKRSKGSVTRMLWRAVGRLLVAVAVVCVCSAAMGRTVTVTHPANLTRLEVADEEMLRVPTNDANDPWDYWYTPGGRFKLWTGPNVPPGRGGNPTYEGDEDRLIASAPGPTGADPADPGYYQDWTSGFLVAVDPEDSQNAQFIDPFELALNQKHGDDPTDVTNFWQQTFSVGSRDAFGIARVPIELDSNKNPIGWVRIQAHYTLVGDALMVAIVIENQGTQAHSFGLRICFDAGFGQPGGNRNDGQPIFLPNGQVVTSEAVIRGPFDEKNYTWVSYDPANPLVALRGLVGTAETAELYNPGVARYAAGMPDQIEFGQLRTAGVGVWNFTPNPAAPILGMDWAYAVKWEAKELKPGESRRYVTWYGVGSSTPSYDYPFAAMAYVPTMLKAAQDPNTGEYRIVDPSGQSPFPVALYIDNYGPSPLLNAAGRVRLPAGFDLSSGIPTANMGIIPHDALKWATWQVTASATRPGRAKFRFTAPGGRVLEATVDVPVLPVLNPLPASDPAFEMVSFPYIFANNSARHVLSSLGDLSPGGPATIVRYDPTEANPAVRYKFYPDPFASAIEPGKGYWLLNLNRIPIELPDDRTPVPTDLAYNISVSAGWNQIGNPFHYTIDFSSIQVIDQSNRRWTMEEAIERQLLLPTLFWWDPLDRQYKWEVNPADVEMTPYMGYWLLAYEDLVLLVPPPVFQWTASAPRPQRAATEAPALDGWQLTLWASTPGARSEPVTIGAARSASDNWDRWDLPAPPEPAGLREPRVQAVATGPGQTECLRDVRALSSGKHEWLLTVRTNQPDVPVTVHWPDLSSLPDDLVATLVDLETGARCYMRTSPGYTFRSSAIGRPRQFQVIVRPRSSTLPIITSAQAQPTAAGASIVYTLAAPAQVTIVVRNISGRTVRVLAADRTAPAGTSQVVWNGLNDAGSPVPAGRYLVHIKAVAPDTGQTYQAVRPLQLTR